MHALFITLAFLMMLATLVTGRVKEFFSHSHATRVHKQYQKIHECLSWEREESFLYDIKNQLKQGPSPEENGAQKETPPPPPKPRTAPKSSSLEFNVARPPNNARLNFYHLNVDETCAIAARLLRRLYGEHPAFLKDSSLEHKLLDALKAQQEASKDFHYPDDLAHLQLGDSHLQSLLAELFTGCLDEKGRPLPSLLDYITFDAHSKSINLMHAPPEILEVVILHPQATKKVLKARADYWRLILDQEAHYQERLKGECYTRTDLKKLIQGSMQEILSSFSISLPKTFDFSLGNEGSILFVLDPETQLTVREKVIEN